MATIKQKQGEALATGMKERERAGSADLLNRALSDEFTLYTKTRKYHWNVTGHHFYSLHKLLEEQYEELDESIDEIAERARSVGFPAFGTMKEYLECTTLQEQPGVNPDAMTMVHNLVADHEKVISNLREFIDKCDDELHDKGTSDFFTAKMEAHEKMAWMLRAFLENEQNVTAPAGA